MVKWTKLYDSDSIQKVENGRKFVIYKQSHSKNWKVASFKASRSPIFYNDTFQNKKEAIKFVDCIKEEKDGLLDRISRAKQSTYRA